VKVLNTLRHDLIQDLSTGALVFLCTWGAERLASQYPTAKDVLLAAFVLLLPGAVVLAHLCRAMRTRVGRKRAVLSGLRGCGYGYLAFFVVSSHIISR